MQEADHILIPLLSGDFTLAQCAGMREHRERKVATLFITTRTTTPTSPTLVITPEDVIAVTIIDFEKIPYADWPIVGYEAIPTFEAGYPQDMYDYNGHIYEPAIVEALANALHGLYPWDGFPDPTFFSDMLSDPEITPPKARLTADFPKPESP